MRNRLFIWSILAFVAVAAIGFWRHRPQPLNPRLPSSVPVTSAPTPTHFILNHRVKMVLVGEFDKKKDAVIPLKRDWSDVELIADPEAEYAKRREAIARLPLKLSNSDWAVLRKFLLVPAPADNGQRGQVIKNELLDKLCAMQPPPYDLGNTLTDMFQNLLQDEVIRDYAIQHLATLDQALALQGGNGAEQEERADQGILWNALTETGDSIAGSALLGLVRLSEQPNSGVDSSKVATSALQMAQEMTSGELSQITAYQVCAQLNVTDALSTIESAARTGQTLSVQISAIGALGSLGGSDDIPLLQNLLKSNQERLQLPAQTAIDRIEQRITQQRRSQSS